MNIVCGYVQWEMHFNFAIAYLSIYLAVHIVVIDVMELRCR